MRAPVQIALRRLTRMTRRLALRTAGRPGSPNAVVIHVGRTSGRSYRTPVTAARHDRTFLIALPYGQRTDWSKNVLAAGSATLIDGGQTYRLDRPEVIPMDNATRYFRPREQRLQRRFHVDTALRLRIETGPS